MQNPFLLAILPAILVGVLNGYYWGKHGYSRSIYTVYGILIGYVLFLKSFQYLLK